jgi:chemotaxis signal transduction protein
MNQQATIIQGAEANQPGNIADKEKRVRCLAFDFFSYRMLVPSVAIAEVTDVKNIESKKGAPNWFAGMMRWREVFVPVIIFEKIMNETASIPKSYKKMIIFNAPNNIGGMHFIAVGCQSIPSLIVVDESRLAVSEKHHELLTCILLDGEEYVIPNISVFEKRVTQALIG